MTDDQGNDSDQSAEEADSGGGFGVPSSFRAQIVGKVAIGVSAVTALVMIATIVMVSEKGGPNYHQIVGAFSATKNNLAMAMVISGLALVTLAGVLTWFVTLYSSFRVAGPLFRFSRNLEMVASKGPVPVIGIREGDLLQGEADELSRAVDALADHLEGVRDQADKITQVSERSGPVAGPELSSAVSELKKRIADVRF